MRLYTFINMYLSSIQQGIQTAHIVSELFTKYDDQDFCLEDIKEWAENHKTIIVLNGGYSSNIEELRTFFFEPENFYPWVEFRESYDALDNALTGIGIILPERIYTAATAVRQSKACVSPDIPQGRLLELNDTFNAHDFSDWELRFIDRLNQYSLAQ